MSLQLYLGCAGSGKSHKLYKHIIDESLANPGLTYLFIVPEQYNLSTQRRLISMHPKKGILNIDVLSFSRLSHRVFEEVGYRSAKGAVIDDIGKNLILRHMASGNEDKLTALSGVFTRLGYISEVKSVISEFMQYGIGDRELSGLIEKSSGHGNLQAKLTDIRFLYGEFLKYIKEKYITTEEILQKVRDAVPRSAKLKKSVIILDGYTGFTPVQLDLIRELLKNCIDVYLTVLLDSEECLKRSGSADYPSDNAGEEQELFYLSNKTLASLNRICTENKIGRKKDVILTDEIPARFLYDENDDLLAEDKRSNELIHLERNLFRVKEKVFDGEGSGIHIFTGTNPEEEAVETAVRIERLIREKGYHYRDIAVVSGDTDTYMNACARAFSRYEIPFFIDKTRPVLLNPMVEYIRSLFDIITDDCSYEAVFRYLKTMVSDCSAEEIDALENYVLRYGIRGRKQWNKPFIRKPRNMKAEELAGLNTVREKIAAELDAFYEELLNSRSSNDTGSGADEADNKEKITERTRFDVRQLSTALYRLISKQRLQEKMEALADKMEQAGDMLRAREFSSIYEEVCVLLDKMVRLLPCEIIGIDEYAELLDAGFAEIRTGIIPPSDDYVQIGDITRTRLGDIKALFFMGVNDGIIPSAASNGGIISDMEREFLISDESTEKKQGKDKTGKADKQPGKIELAPTARVQAYTQRMYLYMLLTKPSRELYISYSGISRDGKSLNPSYLVKTILRMFPCVKTERPGGGILDRAYNRDTGYDELTEGVQAALHIYNEDELKEYGSLLKVLASDRGYNDRIRRMIESSLRDGSLKHSDEISRAVAKVLYGSELVCSITRLENYARCAYSHFLKYGLGLKERELFSFEARDIGSIFHDALQSYAELLKERNLRWQDVNGEERGSIIDEAIERCISDEDYDAIYGSFRTKYMIHRMRRIMSRTVDTLTLQLGKGSFEPYDFEFAFDGGNDYESLNISVSDNATVRLIGRIDRMDVCEPTDEGAGEEAAEKGRIYVKIIDYKSGNKSFDPEGVYLGLDLQLVVYMNAACEFIRRRYGDKEPIPAGIFYYHIDDPYITARDGLMSDDRIADEIAKQLKMKGLVNSDEKIYRLMDSEFDGSSAVIPVNVKKDGGFGRGSSVADTEEFGILSEYVRLKIKEAGQGMLNGNIKPEPHMRSENDKSPCAYCEYHGICGYKEAGISEDETPGIPEDVSDTDEASDVFDKMRQYLKKSEGESD